MPARLSIRVQPRLVSTMQPGEDEAQLRLREGLRTQDTGKGGSGNFSFSHAAWAPVTSCALSPFGKETRLQGISWTVERADP